MKNYHAVLSPGSYYHVYNRSVGSGKLFRSDGNYSYFLKKFKFYISPIAEIYSYCLLPTHFHFLIRIKDQNLILNRIQGVNQKSAETSEQEIEMYLSKQFSNLFNGYTKALNKQIGRHGALFSRPFNRIEVNDISYLKKLVHYIHFNPKEAGYCDHPSKWKWSSYSEILLPNESFLSKKEVLDLFDGSENFIFTHNQNFGED